MTTALESILDLSPVTGVNYRTQVGTILVMTTVTTAGELYGHDCTDPGRTYYTVTAWKCFADGTRPLYKGAVRDLNTDSPKGAALLHRGYVKIAEMVGGNFELF